MDPVTIAIGVFAIGYGLYTWVLRVRTPEKFGKLAAMKKMWGDTAGLVLHVVAYTVVPIAVGILALYSGLRGVSLF